MRHQISGSNVSTSVNVGSEIRVAELAPPLAMRSALRQGPPRTLTSGSPETRSDAKLSRRRRLYLGMLGPGIMAMLANNDAGGMMSYALTGKLFGITLFLPLLLLLVPVGYSIQEMSMRLSVVTRKGYPELLNGQFGTMARYSSVSVLVATNILYVIAEFAGMTAGLETFGAPIWVADVLSFGSVSAVMLLSGTRTKQRLMLLVGGINCAFIVVTILMGVHGENAPGLAVWSMDAGANGGTPLSTFVVAAIGNAVAPFMLYFGSGSTLDSRMRVRDVRVGQIDIALGAILQSIFAAAVVVCGAELAKLTNNAVLSPRDLIGDLAVVAGRVAGDLFAVGLFNAGLLAAVTISFSSAYAVAGSQSEAMRRNPEISRTQKFYRTYFGSLLIGAVAVLLPGMPLGMTAVCAQIAGAALLVPDLIFLVLLTSNGEIMGWHANTLRKTAIGWGIVILYSATAIATLIVMMRNLV